VPVEHEEGEKETALAPREAGIHAAPAPFDDERATQLDSQVMLGGPAVAGHTKILPTSAGYTLHWRREMRRVIRCECGFVARGDTDDETVDRIREHMRTDHPALYETVELADLYNWISVE
jgi:predicted small metal-binding protein